MNFLQVATRLQDFESQITAQLSNLQTDFARGPVETGKAFGAVTTGDIDHIGYIVIKIMIYAYTIVYIYTHTYVCILYAVCMYIDIICCDML